MTNPFDLNKDGEVNKQDAENAASRLKTAWYQDPIAVLIFCVLSFAVGFIVKKMFF